MRAGGMHRSGGMRAGGMHRGGGMRGGRGGGRRSDIRLKHDIVLLGRLDNGLGFYRFSYNGGGKAYVGVMAQEVQQVMPQAVARGPDGYLTVNYDRLGLKFESYDQWMKAGAQIPATDRIKHRPRAMESLTR
jgi:Chaperone of endosialidase